MKYIANQDFINTKIREVIRKGKKVPVNGCVRQGDICQGKNLSDLCENEYKSEVSSINTKKN
jgi:hypothetical protein